MEVMVFKTNIKYKRQLNVIQQHITAQPEILKWNVDLKDIDKVLRVEAKELHPLKVVALINSAGYKCEELGD